MATTLDKMIKRLPRERRAKVEARAAELIAEEMTLRDMRKARELTQAEVAKQLRIGQDTVSRLEKRSDLLLSTLQSFVQVMGGRLRLVAEFPDRPPVVLTGLTGEEEERMSNTKTRRTRKSRASRS
ncbi:MAG: helix-turn-helix domain-containing protein [Planctomycetota bacterium]|jgi:transcriptional regulator with XRE-family HTH domain